MKELTRREREQLERKESIISKAEKLFFKNGLEKVSMDDVAKESEFTKRTIYRYFTCKEDLIFAVALRGYNILLNMIKSQSKKGSTGFEKARLAYYAYYDYYCKYPHMASLTNISGSIKSGSADTEIPHRKKYMEIDKCLFEELIGMFLEGKADGSIRADLKMPHVAYSSIFVAVGFFQILSLSGSTYTKHIGLDKEEFIKFTIEMLLDSLKSK